MRYLKKKEKPDEAILLGTTIEDTIALQRMWDDKALRGAWHHWKGIQEEAIHETVEEVLKMFPETKSYILINNS